MLLGMIFRLYSEIFVEIHALFLEILHFEFVTLFVKHPVQYLYMYVLPTMATMNSLMYVQHIHVCIAH